MLKKQVFLSYRHESAEHGQAVRRLGNLLRGANLPVVLDQFYLDEKPGGPDEGGWPKWCEDTANQSACVLVIASAGWFAAYTDPTEGPGGLGAAMEARLFRQDLYDKKGNNERLRLAFLHDIAPDFVPKGLRAWHQFRPFANNEDLNQLVHWIASLVGVSEVNLPTVRWPESVPFEPDCADRCDTEWPVIRDLLTGRCPERVLLIEGKESGLGKTKLLREAAHFARLLDIPVARINFKGGLDVTGVLGQFQLELEPYVANFCRSGADKIHMLRKDLRSLRRPVLVLFDHFEDVADNLTMSNWLTQHFLPEVETALGLAVIVAGQRVPDHAEATWSSLTRQIQLQPIEKLEHWQPWVDRKFPSLKEKGAHLPTILMLAKGNPAIVSDCCSLIAKG